MDAHGTGVGHAPLYVGPAMQATQRDQLVGLRRLCTQAQAIDAALPPHGQRGAISGRGIAFHRDLGVRQDAKRLPHRCGQCPHAIGRQERGGTAPKIHGIHRPSRHGGRSPRLPDPTDQLVGVRLHGLGSRSGKGAKIAIGALGAAKRNMQIQSKRFFFGIHAISPFFLENIRKAPFRKGALSGLRRII